MANDAREWNLDHIITNDTFEDLYREVEAHIPENEKELAGLSPDMSAEDFRAFCERDEAVTRQQRRLAYRPHLEKDIDKDDQATQQRVSRLTDLHVRIAQAERPIGFWLQGKTVNGKEPLDDENAARLFAAVPDIEYQLHRSRLLARHTLSQAEEDISTTKSANLKTPLNELRGKIEKSQRYRFKPAGAARARTITTTAAIRSFFDSAIPAEREEAYRTMLAEFTRNEEFYFPIYSGIVKDWSSEAKLRGHASPISVRNTINDIPDVAVETLMRVCTENNQVFQEYFRWKAARLGMERLRRFDVFAPLDAPQQDATLDEGIAIVLETFGQISPTFRDHAKRIIDENHIHSHPSTKKKGGAYCSNAVPSIAPYVLLNWMGKEGDVSTLAHELGHGVHFLYAAHHSANVQFPPLPLAETASTLAESVLFDRQLEHAPSDAVRAAMLSEKISHSYATIMRQNNFVRFEQMAHERIPQGITRDELSELWLSTLHDQYGDAVDVDPIFRHEWASIPHIVSTPFYCYAYSFGDLLSLSLYARYKQDPSYFGEIERILQAGGAENPDTVLKRAGVDMRDSAFWQGSFDIIRGWQTQLERYSSP